MLINPEELDGHLRKESDDAVLTAYALLANAVLPVGMTVKARRKIHGEPELQFFLRGRTNHAAVLNKRSVLWYVQKRAARNPGRLASELAIFFEEVEPTGYDEVKVRLTGPLSALAMIGWLHQHHCGTVAEECG